MNKDVVIKVENLSKKYTIGKKDSYLTLRDKLVELPKKIFKKETKKEFWALKNVSFEVKRGEVLGVIGRNGAGKSTLLKILSRIVEPTSGQITLKGRVASLLEVGTGFNQELTGRENIYLNGSILGMTKKEIKKKFDEIVEFSGVEKFLDTPVKHYSSGMYVRLAFAVAAHLESEILLVDEVLAVGDAEFQKKCLGKMDSLAKSGRTVIFVSHDSFSVNNLCKTTICMNNGKIKFSGQTEETIDKYLKSGKDRSLHNITKHQDESSVYIKKIKTIFNNSCLIIFGDIYSRKIMSQINIGFSLHDRHGKVMSIIYSAPKHYYSLKRGINHFKVTITDINFTPGTYLIKTRFEQLGNGIYWPNDYIADFYIPVNSNDQHSRQEILINGQVLLEASWCNG